MDDGRRRRYLHAMGVVSWQARAVTAAALGESSEQAQQAAPLSASPVEHPPAVPARAQRPAVEPAPRESAAVDEMGGGCVAEQRGELQNKVVAPSPVEVGVSGMSWDPLARTVAECRDCALCETRTNTVFGVGNPDADLMVVGEAPGADEDRAGEPFVGPAGQLLNRMLLAIGLSREQVYIANILKCRPPGNRDPHPQEVLRCRAYLERQIDLVQPRLILAVGRIAAQNLLRVDTPIGKMRGRWMELGERRTPITVTYHPAYLLRSPDQKVRAWQDLMAVARRLGVHHAALENCD